jgi:glyoxylase-like metal-dependent hydrolase (beta-lactamase superfamily II)
MAYLTEPQPARGIAQHVAPGVRRLTAGNSGPMTYHGGTVVIDPGPDEADHLDAIIAATSGKIAGILLTHTHLDHFGAADDLRRRTNARVYAFHQSFDPDFRHDVGLFDGSSIGSLKAVHTPGHCSDHLCFARADGILFSGDHVMGWCTTVVGPPPRGDMAAFFASLRRLASRSDTVYLPGHGPALPDPVPYVEEVLRRRMMRETEIEAAVRNGVSDPARISASLYHKTHPVLKRAAERNVLSHLSKLVAEGRLKEDGAGGFSAR